MSAKTAKQLSDDFWCSVSIRKQDFDPGVIFFVFEGRDGGRYFVAARGMEYRGADA
jgi:hypothetical protein